MQVRADQLKGHLDLLVLGALQDAPAHGYALIERLRAASGGIVELPSGTIYPVLHRLEQAGWIASDWHEANGRRRRVYRLTRRGQTELGRQQAAWRTFADAVTRIAGTPPGPPRAAT